MLQRQAIPTWKKPTWQCSRDSCGLVWRRIISRRVPPVLSCQQPSTELLCLNHPWEVIAMDLISSFPRTSKGKNESFDGHQPIHHMDRGIFHTRNDFRALLNLLRDEFVSRYGNPRCLQLDIGSEFPSQQQKQRGESNTGLHISFLYFSTLDHIVVKWQQSCSMSRY